MKIKLFTFPTFEEWVQKSKNVKVDLGAYRCEIRVFSWTAGTCKATYMFAVSLSNMNPLNIYTDKLFYRKFEYEGDIEKLKSWYYTTINEFNVFWENHIKSTYIKMD